MLIVDLLIVNDSAVIAVSRYILSINILFPCVYIIIADSFYLFLYMSIFGLSLILLFLLVSIARSVIIVAIS